MKPVVTADQMRALEAPHLAAGEDLMARAAAAVAQHVLALGSSPLLFVIGPGNNGGDGLFAAALCARTRPVSLWCATEHVHEAGLAAARREQVRFVDAGGAMRALEEECVVVDACFGLGARPGLPDVVALFAEACESLAVSVIAVDLPSGLDADSGEAGQSFRAQRTITFAALKRCHVTPPASERCGEVAVADIGIAVPDGDLRAVQAPDLCRWWPVPGADSDKYSRGVVGLDTGSAAYPGAALLGCAGALNAGAGMVRYLGPVDRSLIVAAHPSAVVGPGRVQAIVAGSGWDDVDPTARMAAVVAQGVPVVADAGALAVLPDADLSGWLLTPHAGELARLLDTEREAVAADPIAHAREAARRTGATVLLKGATQVVAEPSGRATLAVPGPAWTAQAGSGDVLAGVAGTLLAAGLEPWRAGVLAASLQAMTADQRRGPYPPEVLASFFPELIARYGANRPSPT